MSIFSVSSARRDIGLISGACLIVFTFVLASILLLVVDLPRGSLFWKALQNSGHTLVFSLLTLAVLVALRLRGKSLHRTKVLLAVSCIAVFSFGSEYVQSLIGRDASLGDVVLNSMGIVVGCIIFHVYELGRENFRTRSSLILIGVCILGITFKQPVEYAVANVLQPSLPVLTNFENIAAGSKVRASEGANIDIINGSKVWLDNGSSVLQIQFVSGKWPGFTLLELHSNWAGFSKLVFDVFNPTDSEIGVTFRIQDNLYNDQESDHFRRRLSLHPGAGTVVISVESIRLAKSLSQQSREVDITNIQALTIYKTKVESTGKLYFDNFHLE